jgi:alanine dehydrogenase
MRVGVPKEIKVHEYRVGLTPGAAREYVAAGHSVIVETNAGAGIGATDETYRKAGAAIADTAAEIFASADLIVKVKEPQAREWVQLREGQIIFTYLHLAADPAQAKGLMASGCTAIAYETVTDAKGGLPLLAPMSEVAGRLGAQAQRRRPRHSARRRTGRCARPRCDYRRRSRRHARGADGRWPRRGGHDPRPFDPEAA